MASLYTRLISGLVFPLQERIKHHSTVSDRKALEASQWWSPAQIEALQAERLSRLLKRAATQVPYYRDLFARIGFDPMTAHPKADLARLPFLTKAVIRANQDALRADDAVGLARFNTGGSSGEPLIFFIGAERVSRDVAAKWRATRWWDVDIGDREIVLWGSPIEIGAQDRVRRYRDALMRTRLLPAFEMSEDRLDGFLDDIRRMKPAMLFGYPSAFSLIAAHASKRGVRLDDVGIRVVFVTSERLYDHQRHAISEAFGAPVANGYGGRDAGFIAHQCPAGSMHITAEDVVVEIVSPDGRVLPQGEPGEIVVTHLATGDYPFIRYRTGDIGTLSAERCTCGRNLPVMKEIQGRTTDFIVAADGTIMHGLALIYVLRDLPGVSAFKIVQEALDRTTVFIVAGPELRSDAVEFIRAGLGARLGASVHIDVQIVDQIPAEKSGKFRYVVSHVSPEVACAISSQPL
ncbi:AMP-binding protein [Methyloversatilis sp. XJ19-13]|uniref:phenylacetate--CoA ligase family protein n=1 Tax=Methyloversatilis sp. XJ19-13 TaxID=2963430 RepID=UPI00211CC1E6|nr:AMP-binding protein [Methyloversatilis sp. XJ19-13]MCQ9372910.1 AMP-binding protein [Methyloversatilis sp. XJ19-13]